MPTPTRPLAVTTRELAVELPMANCGTDVLSAACMEKRAHGDEVAIPTLPFEPRMVRAVSDDVANVVADDVARYKFPPAFRNVQWLDVREPSESASCGPVDDAIWSDHCGVVVPIPMRSAELR